MRRRFDERAVRSAQRREREDAAPRLLATIPGVESLHIEVREQRAGHPVAEAAYVRRVVVASAPALFVVPCSDPTCDGAHELTGRILTELRRGAARIEGEDECLGTAGSAPCRRVLHWACVAAYR